MYFIAVCCSDKNIVHWPTFPYFFKTQYYINDEIKGLDISFVIYIDLYRACKYLYHENMINIITEYEKKETKTKSDAEHIETVEKDNNSTNIVPKCNEEYWE